MTDQQLYHYRAADGVWRDRCAAHIKATGPYRAVTTPEPSSAKICMECRPWGQLPLLVVDPKPEPQPEPEPQPAASVVSDKAARAALGKLWIRCQRRWFMPGVLVSDAKGRAWIWANVGSYFERHPDARMWHLVRIAPDVERKIQSAHIAARLYGTPEAADREWADILTKTPKEEP